MASRSCAARRILQRSRRTAPTPASLRRRRNTLARVMSPSKETEVKMPSLIPVVQNYHVDEEEEEGEYWDLWDEDTLFFGTTSSGLGSGEGPSTNPNAQHFTVTVSDPGCVNGPREDGYKGGNTGATVQIEVPEDRYVLFEMEDQDSPSFVWLTSSSCVWLTSSCVHCCCCLHFS